MNEMIQKIRTEVQNIVSSGKAIRESVAQLVTTAAREAWQQVGGGVAEVARAVADGAREGAAKVTGSTQGEAIRQVADGLADGLTASAEAARLSIEEATARGKRFAEQDLVRLKEDIGQARDRFVSSMTETAKTLRSEATAQAGDLKGHIEHASTRLSAAFDQVLEAVRKDGASIAKQAMQAGGSAASHAAGALFAELGTRLQSLGAKLRQ